MLKTTIRTEHFQIIRNDWKAMLPNADLAARLFYTRLFLIDPSLSVHFRLNAEEEAQRLVRALGIVVHGLGQPRILLPLLRSLGRLQAASGVKSSHYDAVGKALMWTLEITLAEAFTDASRRAWEGIYAAVSEVLKEAALEAPGAGADSMRMAA